MNKLPVWLLALLSLLLYTPFWTSLGLFPAPKADPDALQQLSFAYAFRDAIWNHFQYPLWNPFFGGGVAWAGYIYNPGISPTGLIYLLFEEQVAVKMLIVLVHFLGCLGVYLTAKEWLGIEKWCAFLAACIYGCSLWLPSRTISGNFDEAVWFLIPLGAALFYRLLNKQASGYLFPILIVALFAQGKFVPLVLGICLVIIVIVHKTPQFSLLTKMKWLATAYFFGVLMSLNKLLPLLRLLERDTVDQTQYALGNVYPNYSTLVEFLYMLPREPQEHIMLVVGMGVVVFASLFSLLKFKKHLAMIVMTLISALFTMGSNSGIRLANVVKEFPIFDMMNSFAKYWNIGVLFGLSILAAAGLRTFFKYMPFYKRKLYLIVGLACLIPPIIAGTHLNQQIFTFEMPKLKKEPFHHFAINEILDKKDRYRYFETLVLEHNQYIYIKRGMGFLTWYGNFVYPEHAVPKFIAKPRHLKVEVNKEFKEEVYCLDNPCPHAHIEYLGYNRIDLANPDKSDHLIVNFNYDPNWHCKGCRISEHEGLLKLSSLTGESVSLSYSDSSFTIGLIASLLGLAGWIWLFVRRKAA